MSLWPLSLATVAQEFFSALWCSAWCYEMSSQIQAIYFIFHMPRQNADSASSFTHVRKPKLIQSNQQALEAVHLTASVVFHSCLKLHFFFRFCRPSKGGQYTQWEALKHPATPSHHSSAPVAATAVLLEGP